MLLLRSSVMACQGVVGGYLHIFGAQRYSPVSPPPVGVRPFFHPRRLEDGVRERVSSKANDTCSDSSRRGEMSPVSDSFGIFPVIIEQRAGTNDHTATPV